MAHIWMRQVRHTGLCVSCDMTHSSWGPHDRHAEDEITPVTCMNESCHTYKWVMSHTWMSQVKHMNESCHTHRAPPWLTCRGSKVHFCLAAKVCHESCHTYERVMSHVSMSHVTTINESSHTWFASASPQRCAMSHVARMKESCHTYQWVMSQL